MTACDRFEREAILRLEQGRALDEHFATCPDCRQAADAYQRLQAGLASTGAAYQPRPDWQARTWAAIARRRKRRRWLRTLVPAAVGACVVALVLIPQLPRTPQEPGIEVKVLPAGSAWRGAEAGLGDRLLLRAQTGGARHAELRVYLNDTMMDLDRPVRVLRNGTEVFHGVVRRRKDVMARTLAERGDRAYMFCAQVVIPAQ